MFKIAASPRYWHKVEVPFKLEDGSTRIQKFEAEFRRIPQGELEELIDQGRKGQLKDAAVVESVMTNWRGVADESGEELPFTKANLDRLCAIVPTQSCIVKAFFDSVGGARSGN